MAKLRENVADVLEFAKKSEKNKKKVIKACAFILSAVESSDLSGEFLEKIRGTGYDELAPYYKAEDDPTIPTTSWS